MDILNTSMHLDIRKIKHLQSFVSLDDIVQLYNLAQTADTEPATTGKIINGVYTTEYNKWCTANFVDYRPFEHKVLNVVESVKKKAEELYDLTCISNEIHFLKYINGAKYHAHVDGQFFGDDDVAHRAVDRDLTCVIYLNEDYKGGELKFDLFNYVIKPNQGDVMMYPTTFEYVHSVKAVTGTRYAIVVWFKTTPELNKDKKINSQTAEYLKRLINHNV